MNKIIKVLLFITVPYFAISQTDTIVEEIFDSSSAIPIQPSEHIFDNEKNNDSKLNKEINIIGVGDVMLGTAYPQRIYLPPNEDCKPLLSDIKSILESADITFGNLEGAITNSHKNAKTCKDPSVCYVFAMPEKFVSCLTYAGFDLMSIANNHSGDFNYQGRRRTAALLDSVGINWAGTTDKPYTIFEKDGVKYGFAAFSPNWETPQITNIQAAKNTVKLLDSLCDIVIVSFHGGAEGSKYEHVTRNTELFYGENRGNVYQFSHAVIDAGADIVFGHGPHVTRAIELYKNKFIIYSLGNFCTYGKFNLSGPNGYAPIVSLKTNSEGDFISGKIYPIIQIGEGGAKLDSLNRVIKRLQALTLTDFPESPLKILDNGDILKK